MKIIKMRPSEVLTIYFDQAHPIDLPYAGLAAPFDAPTERLEDDLFGWNRLFLDRRLILWSCPDQLALILLAVTDAIYLFTFTQASDFGGCLDLLRRDWNL